MATELPSGARQPLPPGLAEALATRFGERFSTGAAVCLHHGKDESSFAPQPPDGVVFAQSTRAGASNDV